MTSTPRSLFLALFGVLSLCFGGLTASGQMESDLLVSYTATYASGAGGTDNVEVNVMNAVAASNAFNVQSGTGAKMHLCALYQSVTDNTNRTTTGGIVSWLSSNNAAVADVVAKGAAVGADLVAYICQDTDNTIAGVAQQPGMYSSLNSPFFYSLVLAHETAGHCFGRAHADGFPTTPISIMLNNYCSGGGANPAGYYTNPQLWVNNVQLIGPGNNVCSQGSPVNGGDNSNPTATTALAVANSRDRVVSGPNLTHLSKRWVFNRAASSAPAGTTVTDSVTGTALATVQGAGASFTGSALRIPGGSSSSGAAFLQLPGNLFTGMTATTIEIWATPLAVTNYARIADFNNGTSNYLTLSSCVGTSLTSQLFESVLSGTKVTNTAALATTAGVPHLYTIVYTPDSGGASGVWSWYRDGDLVTHLAVAYPLSGLPDVNSWLGRSAFSADAYANNDYAEARISNVAMSAADILANYRLGPAYPISSTNVTLAATDASGASSFNAAGSWSNGAAPSSGNTYETYGFSLRTPANATSYTFGGGALAVNGGSLAYSSMGSSTITVNNLTLNNATLWHRGSGTLTMGGSIAVGTGGSSLVEAQNGGINLNSTLSGNGTLVYVGNTVSINGANSGFTGKTSVGNGYTGSVSINAESRLGVNPSMFAADQLTLNRGTLYTTATMTLGSANRGILLDVDGGTFNVAAGTTLTVSSVISSPNLGTTVTAGSLNKENSGTLVLNGPANTFNGMVFLDTGSSTANDGILRVASAAVLATARSPLYLLNNNNGSSTLQLDGSTENVALPQRVYLYGRTGTVPGIENLTGSNSVAGVAIWAGGGNYYLQSDAGSLGYTGTISSGVTGTRTITFLGNGDQAVLTKIENGTADTLGVTKAGAGTLTISGTCTYTGPTAVNAGTLKLNTSFATTNTLTIASGATLSGTGSTSAAVTVNGNHAPGNLAGKQTFTGALSYGAASHLRWNLLASSTAASASNQVAAGAVTVASGAALDLVFNGSGSTVNFFDTFWTTARSWTVLSSSSSTMTGTFALGSATVDAAGQMASKYGAFTLVQGAGGVTLNWTPNGYTSFRGTSFGANAGTASTSGPLVDPDGDGVSNIQEYYFGTTPTAAAASPLQTQVINSHLTMTFPRNIAATDVTATVQGADSLLGAWTDLATSVNGGTFTLTGAGPSVTETGAGTVRTVTFQDAYTIPDASHPTRFLRLKIQQP